MLVHQLGERKAERILAAVRTALSTEPLLRLDSLDLVDAETMRPVDTVERPAMLAIAARIGQTRLIDNVRLASEQAAT
jgi:pantoate--beta-alanine ligase